MWAWKASKERRFWREDFVWNHSISACGYYRICGITERLKYFK